MRCKLGEKFGVVFSFAVVVTATESVIPLKMMHRYILSLKGVVPRQSLFVLIWKSIVGRNDI